MAGIRGLTVPSPKPMNTNDNQTVMLIGAVTTIPASRWLRKSSEV